MNGQMTPPSGAGRAATEFRALAHELARHLTVEVSS